MAYGDYDGPDKPNKGQEDGACNRSLCQAEPAIWWNHGSHAWYCVDCMRVLNDAWARNNWRLEFAGYNHPQFETREMMEERKHETSKQR